MDPGVEAGLDGPPMVEEYPPAMDMGEAIEPIEAAPPPQEEPKPVETAWWKNSKLWINLVGYITITMVLVIIKFKPDFMPKFERSFSCNDVSLMYPRRDPTVQQRTLIISTVSIFLMSVFISEGVYTISPEYFPQRSQENLAGETQLKDKIFTFINLVTSKVVYGYLGLVLTMNFTFHIQHLAGGLRPTFLQICQLKHGTCNDDVGEFAQCNEKNEKVLLDARLSFPSEYASISFFMTVFSSLIIERAISNEYFALKIAVQSSYIFWAIYLSASCVKDHRNHPIDVVAGMILGVIIALITDYLSTYQEYQDIGYDLNLPEWDHMDAMDPNMGMGMGMGMEDPNMAMGNQDPNMGMQQEYQY